MDTVQPTMDDILTRLTMQLERAQLTMLTRRWMNFFQAVGLAADPAKEPPPAELRANCFTVESHGITFTVVVREGMNTDTPRELSEYAKRIMDKLPRPLLVVDTPVFNSKKARRAWSRELGLYGGERNEVPILGVLVWDRAHRPYIPKRGEPIDPLRMVMGIEDKKNNGKDKVSAAQLVEEEGRFGIVWSHEGWVYSNSFSVDDAPPGFRSLPYGSHCLDSVGLWRDARKIWKGMVRAPYLPTPQRVGGAATSGAGL